MDEDIYIEEDEFDTSWIDKEERLCSIQQNYVKEPLKDIALFFIYLSTENEIKYISKEREVLEHPVISKERLLQIIQTKRSINDVRYKLDDISIFQVPLEPEQLQSFSTLEDFSQLQFLKSLQIFDEIKLMSTIFIFQDLHALFFLFKEQETPIKSILRNGTGSRITKKVRLDDSYLDKKRKSFKRMLRTKV
jgi:hypothetical protein